MKPNVNVAVVGLIGLALFAGAVALVTGHGPRATHAGHAKAQYYCPMHPSYTSDRPGDCPICNMKLVKKEPEAAPAGAGAHAEHAAKPFASICYLHNCEKLHEGRPCPMTVVAKPGERVTCPICGTHIAEAAPTTAERKILYWTDPMMPGYKADKPGTSPMGMALVPVYAEEHPRGAAGMPDGYAPVLLTPQKQQLIGVKTALVERRPLVKQIRASGTVAHDPELYQVQTEYLQAVQALERANQQGNPDVLTQAQRLVEAAHIHLQHLGLSEELIQDIATGKAPQHSLLFAHPGQPVWVYAKVYEYELPLVRVGQEVAVDSPALPGEAFRGAVKAIDQMVDEMTRTTRVRALLDNPDGHLKPDMYINASIAVDLGEVLSVPDEAVFDTGAKQLVFVDKGEGLFEPRDVTVGAQGEGFREIRNGLAQGERVVVSGNFLIDSESRLKAALQGMTAEGANPHGQ